MGLISSKTTLAGAADSDLCIMMAQIRGLGRMVTDDEWENWIPFWPPPYGNWRWEILNTIFGNAPYQYDYCGTGATDRVNEHYSALNLLTRDQTWSNRQACVELIWAFDNAASNP